MLEPLPLQRQEEEQQGGATPLHLLLQLQIDASLSLSPPGQQHNPEVEAGAAALQRELLGYRHAGSGSGSGFTQELQRELEFGLSGAGEQLALVELPPAMLERARKGWNLLADLLHQAQDQAQDAADSGSTLELLRGQYCPQHSAWAQLARHYGRAVEAVSASAISASAAAEEAACAT